MNANPPDLEEYKQEYGSLGPSLYGAVSKARAPSVGSGVPVSFARQAMPTISSPSKLIAASIFVEN